MKQITIKVDNTLTRLAGNDFGEEIFNEQVKNYIDYSDKNIIIFPNNIDNIAISFVQGFIKNITVEEFNKFITIEGSVKLKRNFIKYLNY